ncbi:LacI family DNA-binding transcriptional regulator [Cypionkella sp.]|uniref:LacI family DNA-binding transcriptional regulator n=1 Tax=Cypionkella sp. TaxID=2811411 RepID=UPI002726EDB7|nr:LacI family DNA-binding transcriptional regulator [Cypionkella sp.]MDO8986018.1 LacI family DNA-binding transcriptional regulator [Cypionkella sp.]MDP2050332.1 LacI family DNA-binding transcriptional regulator [Cypionkella sp.]
MAHRATISDLAEKAGVSVSTIDRILNGREKVRAATAARVLAAAEELQFYAMPVLRERLNIDRPRIKLGFLLQQSHRTFYQMIADALRAAAEESPDPVDIIIEHIDDLSPEAVSTRMLALGEKVQALAVVTAEHARISYAIEALAAKGVPTYGLISELTSACGTGYIGLDNWRVGRTAAWAIAGLCKRPGKVGILVGNHRYRCQELNESGFRSFCREHGSEFTLLEPLQTYEDKSIARDVTEQLLAREPDLVGLYVSGGGMVGVLDALKAAGRSRSVVTVGHEITEHTRNGLIDEDLALVMAHPISRLASEAIAQMRRDLVSGASLSKRMIGFEIYTPENI